MGPAAGSKPGETHEEALVRELREELGLADAAIGPCVWTRAHAFDGMPGFRGQRERIYLVRVAAFEPRPTVDLAGEHVTALRWWTYDEVQASDAAFTPSRFPALWRELRAGVPAEPIDVGV